MGLEFVNVTLRLPNETMQFVEQVARASGESVESVIRVLVSTAVVSPPEIRAGSVVIDPQPEGGTDLPPIQPPSDAF